MCEPGGNKRRMCDSNSTTWTAIVRRYAIGRQSILDLSKAVYILSDKIRNFIPGVETGWQVEKNFSRPPMDFIYVCNKTVGPLNVPKEHYRFTAITECELTFYQDQDNTVRFRYFIQLTHGQLIHGVSWVKASPEIRFNVKDFDKVRQYVTKYFLKEESDPYSLPGKAQYGIYDGHRHRVGEMYNQVVKGFGSGNILMENEVIEKISTLLKKAFTFFKENEGTIINIINHKLKQQ